jgi:hypothetical protein
MKALTFVYLLLVMNTMQLVQRKHMFLHGEFSDIPVQQN